MIEETIPTAWLIGVVVVSFVLAAAALYLNSVTDYDEQ